MKRLLFLVVLCGLCSLAFSQNGRIPLSPTTQRSGLLQSNSMSGFSTTFSFNSIESNAISNEKGEFSEIYIDGSFPYGEVGSPSLPMITRMIAIPQGATPVVTVNGYSENEFTLADYDIKTLSAKQAPVRKDIDPTTVEYVVNDAAYARDSYTTDEIASVEYLGTMRGIRIGKLTIRPVAYNAAAKTIKVCNDINVTVNFENADAGLTQSMFASTYSPAFNSIYDQLLNKSIFGQSSRGVYDDHPDLYNTPVRMLVICYSGFRDNSALNQWLAWKLQKGYYVDIFYTDETGTTSSAIASFIRTKYNASVAAGNAYTYLITIGDTDQVPQYGQNRIDSSIGNCAYDLGYSSIDYASNSNDYFPDMFYSRISVENTSHLSNYIEKVLVYEKYQMSDGGAYLNNLILVGGWDDDGWTSDVAAPTVRYAQNNYFNTSNTTYGGFENGTLNITISTSSTAGYSGTNNGCYNGINNGVGFLNYTAHGDKQEWYKPQMTAAHVATLSNSGKYFFAVGNCCLTGNFNNTTTTYSPGSAIGTNACFAETMIRVPKAGAVAYIGCSPYSYWYEDFYWGVGAHNYSGGNYPSVSGSTMGVYDAMFVDEYWNSASSLLYLGNLAVAAADASNYQISVGPSYYFQYYHTFGDGSVMPYVTKPEVNNVTYPASIITGTTSLTVNAVAGSYVAVTDNESTIYGVAVANAQGVATVNFTEAIPETGTLYIVVTRQQYQPHFGTVSVIAPNPPVADFTGTPTTIIERESVTFTNTSQYAATCLWNFGDGETSTEMNPVHTYMTPGTYTVTLRIENTLGNDTKTKTDYITVNPNTNPPIADFVASETTINMGSSVTFTDMTQNIPTSWSWTFNGGTPATSTEQNPTITYSEPGQYTVTLVATNAYGSDTETKTAYINVIYPDVVMSNEDLYVCGGTYKDPGGDSSYENNLSYTQTIYPATSGAYVRLTFNEFSLETAGYSGCYDMLYIYDGTSTSAPVLVDGVCGNNNPGTVTATNADGALTIVFTSDYSQVSTGWLADISCYIQEPEAAFTATADGCSHDITLTNESSFATSYLWDFGDGTTSTEANPTHTYAANGTYTIALTVTNSLGSNSTTHEIEISAPEITSVTNASGCANSTLTLSAQGTGTLHWFDAQTGGTELETGDSYTNTFASTTTVYVESQVSTEETYNVGIADNSSATAYTQNGQNRGLTFTVSQALTLVSVDVYCSQNNQTKTITISNSSNQQVYSQSDTLAYGLNTLTLNVELDPGTYNIYASSVRNTYRQNGNFPYSVENVISITGPYNTNTYYYTFYNWIVNTESVCTSERTPVTATIAESGSIDLGEPIAQCGGSVTIDAGNGFNNYIWSNQQTGQSITVNQSGTYTVTATNGQCNASGSIAVTINPIPSVSIAENGNTLTANATSGTGNYSYLWSNSATTQSISITTNGTYCVTATDAIGCSISECSNATLPVININISEVEHGSINGESTAQYGSDYTFTVTPDNCYTIGTVTVNGNTVNLDANNSYTINNVTVPQSISATFNPITYNISAIVGNGGNISVESTANCGEDVTFTVVPETCYEVATVTVNGAPVALTNNQDTITNIAADQTINVTFSPVVYEIAAIVGNGGNINVASTANCGEDVTFTVIPDNCYGIASVTVNGTEVTLNANNQYTINNVTENQTINVTFNQISYTITASAGNGGSITPNGANTVTCGGSISYSIAPADGYMISEVLVDGQSIGSQSSYTFSDVYGNHTISATFEPVPAGQIVITVNADAEGGTVNPTGTQTITEGEDFPFTVTPDACYEIGTVTVNGTEVALDANNSYTIHNVTEEQEINVTFNLITYTIAASAENGGTITPSGDVEVNCGADASFTITPNEGYEIADVIVDGQSAINDIASYATIGASASYTFSNVTANEHSIVATFSLIPVEVCNTVTDLEVSVEPYGNMLSWTAVENAVSYRIFRNDETTAIANETSTSFVDLNGEEGDNYYIVTICQNGVSDPSEPVTAISTSIDTNSISVELYPNPTDGKFMIECNEMTTVEIFNMVGQSIGMIEVNSDTVSIDASAWTSGIYSVRITTENSTTIVKQIIKQ